MQKHTVLIRDSASYNINLGIDTKFDLNKDEDYKYYIETELEKNINPVTDVEYIRFKPSNFNYVMNFNYTGKTSYNVFFNQLEIQTLKPSFAKSFWIFEYYDSNEKENQTRLYINFYNAKRIIGNNILITKNGKNDIYCSIVSRINESTDEIESVYDCSKSVDTKMKISFTNNNELSFIKIPQNIVNDNNINKIYLKVRFFDAKSGQFRNFKTNKKTGKDEDIYVVINLDKPNYTWSFNDKTYTTLLGFVKSYDPENTPDNLTPRNRPIVDDDQGTYIKEDGNYNLGFEC